MTYPDYPRLYVNDSDLIVCSEHGDEAVYVDLTDISGPTVKGRWECGHPGCIAFRIYDRPTSYRIPPPDDPDEAREWAAGVEARRAAGRGTFVGDE